MFNTDPQTVETSANALMYGLLGIQVIVTGFLGWLMVRRAAEKVDQAFSEGYRHGVAEGLVWPDQNPKDAQPFKEEIDQCTARYYVNILNEAFDLDPLAVTRLFETTVPVHKDMIKHCSIPCAGPDDTLSISPIGIVNGLLPVSRTRYRVATVYNDQGVLFGFQVYDMQEGKLLKELNPCTL